jgi:ubiquinone/menaquinone biosynthesis C-methylase UbiE
MFIQQPYSFSDPLAGSQWSSPDMVAGFAQSAPNATLIRYSESLQGARPLQVVDVGCGAGRNLIPLARMGCRVLGVDLSWPMLRAAAERVRSEHLEDRVTLALASMDRLPVSSATADLIIAHGVWNLAKTSTELRGAIREATRIAKPGAALFVFTFSRNTLPPDARSIPGEPFAFTQFSGEPQTFLTSQQLASELAYAGFSADPAVPLTEHNKRAAGARSVGGPPVIYEAAYRYGLTKG